MHPITRRDFIRKAEFATAIGCSQDLAKGERRQGSGGADSETPDELWMARNSAMEIAVNTKTGTIDRLVDKVSGEDYCHQNVTDPNWPTALAPNFEVGRRICGLLYSRAL